MLSIPHQHIPRNYNGAAFFAKLNQIRTVREGGRMEQVCAVDQTYNQKEPPEQWWVQWN